MTTNKKANTEVVVSFVKTSIPPILAIDEDVDVDDHDDGYDHESD